mmetsp:Transcript_49133/g.155526  ORF Transcript_49133/g.155526 Transcript_49133/m.155526 type:complete len:139 (-) Transcript_49133:250-666(-)
MLGLSTTTAAALLTGHTLVAKSLMTVLFRAKITAKATAKQEVDKVCASEFYKRVHAAQLNEAEYAPLLIGGLLYLSLKGVEAPVLCTLSVVGQVWYYWLRAFVGHSHEGGIDPPPYVPGALMRYAALGMLAYNIYKTG